MSGWSRKSGQAGMFALKWAVAGSVLFITLSLTAAARVPSPRDGHGFDLARCEVRHDGLYKCPHLKKPVCAPGASRHGMDCIRAMNRHIFVYVYPET